MKWMRNNELPVWAYLSGGLLLAVGALINVFTKNVLLGIPLICVGIWLMRWWYEAPADRSGFRKLSEQQFRFYRSIIVGTSWGILVLTVAAVCLRVFGVLS